MRISFWQRICALLLCWSLAGSLWPCLPLPARAIASEKQPMPACSCTPGMCRMACCAGNPLASSTGLHGVACGLSGCAPVSAPLPIPKTLHKLPACALVHLLILPARPPLPIVPATPLRLLTAAPPEQPPRAC